MIKGIAQWIGYWFLASIFLIGMIYIGVPAAQSLIFAAKIASFPSVQGVMDDHKIKTEVTRRQSEEHGPMETRVSYTPWLLYSFSTPDGKTYQAEEMLTAELSSHVKVSQEKAETFAARYPKGSAVTVYYNPENPFEAALTTSKTKFFWFSQIGYLLIAIVVLVMVGWAFWQGLRSLIGGFKP